MDIVEWLRDYYHMDSTRYTNTQIADEIERLREALQKSKDLIDEKLITDAWLIINNALQQKDSE